MTVSEAMRDLQAAIAAANFYAPIQISENLSVAEREQIVKDERWQSLRRELFAPKLAEVNKAAEKFCKVYSSSKWKGEIK